MGFDFSIGIQDFLMLEFQNIQPKINYWPFIPHKRDIRKKLFRIEALTRIADMSFF